MLAIGEIRVRRPPPTIRSAPTRASSSPTTSTASITNVSPTSGSTPTPRRRASSPSSVKPALDEHHLHRRRRLPSPVGQLVRARQRLRPVHARARLRRTDDSTRSPLRRAHHRRTLALLVLTTLLPYPNVPDTVCPATRPPVCAFKRTRATVTESRRVTRARAPSSRPTASRARRGTTRSFVSSRAPRARASGDEPAGATRRRTV